MSFTLVAGWNDATVSGTARIVQQPGGKTIFVPVVNGELKMGGVTRGVQLDSNPGTTYVIFFDGMTSRGSYVSLNPVAIPGALQDGGTHDVGLMTANAHLNFTKHK